MRITPISIRTQNYYKKTTFKGIRDVTKPYEEERRALDEKLFVWNKSGKINKINMQEAAAVKAYAIAQEERLEDQRRYTEEMKRLLQLAKENNASEEKIADLTLKAQKAEEMMRMQAELSRLKKNKGWSKIAGYDQEKTILMDEFINNITMEKKVGQDVSFPNGILFFGPTGNGKTTFAKAFAEQTQCPLIEIDPLTDDLRKDLKNALNVSKENFEKTGTRSIILMDEFDNFGAKTEENKQTIAMLKAVMTDCSDKHFATMFLTTNNPQDIDSILFADGRCPIRVYLDPPNKQNAETVFKYYLEGKTQNPINYNNVIEELFSNQTDGAYSNSRIKTIVETCYKEATKLGRQITEGDLITKIKSTLPDITKEHLQKYAQDIKAICG